MRRRRRPSGGVVRTTSLRRAVADVPVPGRPAPRRGGRVEANVTVSGAPSPRQLVLWCEAILREAAAFRPDGPGDGASGAAAFRPDGPGDGASGAAAFRPDGPGDGASGAAAFRPDGPGDGASGAGASGAGAAHGWTGDLAILVCGDARMRRLNRVWRRVDRPTDVLSFPAGPGAHLGDVAIDLPYARRQARARGHSLRREVQVLLVHGVLHVLGFDHETDDGEMFRRQARLVRQVFGPGPDGVPQDGRIARS